MSGGVIVGFNLVGRRLGAADYDRIKKNIELFPDAEKRERLYAELERVRAVTD